MFAKIKTMPLLYGMVFLSLFCDGVIKSTAATTSFFILHTQNKILTLD